MKTKNTSSQPHGIVVDTFAPGWLISLIVVLMSFAGAQGMMYLHNVTEVVK
jgi:hypothetical protein